MTVLYVLCTTYFGHIVYKLIQAGEKLSADICSCRSVFAAGAIVVVVGCVDSKTRLRICAKLMIFDFFLQGHEV